MDEGTSLGQASSKASIPPEQGSGRFLDSGDEAGTAPGDRKFRPDVEGLRTIAILLVVLFHAGLARVTGGFVGVDVSFVVSGFVITGLLWREHASSRWEHSASGRIRLLAFYGRRSRRILPAAILVIILTILASYHWLGFLTGDDTAHVGRLAALFYANFHFIATGTNYLASQAPPSALQNYWSLSVEEQFYVVYPTLFLLAALSWRRISIRPKLTVLLVRDRGVIRLVNPPDLDQRRRCLLLPVHPCLGTCTRSTGSCRELPTRQASPTHRNRDDLGWPRRDPRGGLHLRFQHAVSGKCSRSARHLDCTRCGKWHRSPCGRGGESPAPPPIPVDEQALLLPLTCGIGPS